MDQPHWYVQVVGCMSANKNRIERERQESEERKSKNKQR